MELMVKVVTIDVGGGGEFDAENRVRNDKVVSALTKDGFTPERREVALYNLIISRWQDFSL